MTFANEWVRKRRDDSGKKEQETLQSRSRLSLFRIAASLRWPTQMQVMQGIAVRNKSDEVWKRDRGATVRFLDDRPKKAKGVASAERARERETGNNWLKKASARVFRSLNVTRTALPRSSDSRSRALHCKLQSGALCNAPLLLLNRALDRSRHTIKIASPTCQTYLRVSLTDPLSVSVA